MGKLLKGRSLSRGIVEGEALVSKQPFSISSAFTADRTHDFFKKIVTNKILIFPIPIGTTTLGFVLLESIIRKIGPKAIVCKQGEPLLSSGALCADIFFDQQFPIVDNIDFSELEKIESGSMVRVNGSEGTLEIL